MINLFKRVFGLPDAQRAVAKELAQAELSLLEAQSGLEWANALVQYNKSRVRRLRAISVEPEQRSVRVVSIKASK